MKPISDSLFIFLTLNLVNNDNDIDNYVNAIDGKIYLVKGRDNELYFIVNGKFVTMSDNEIDYAKSDICVFGRNSRTNKVTALDTKKLKECLDETHVSEYAKELKELFFNYIETRKIKTNEEYRKEFAKAVVEAKAIMSKAKNGPTENYVAFANRISGSANKIQWAKDILDAKDIIERLWKKAFYKPDISAKIDKIIDKIILRVL